ncbi:glyoxalase superfamily protein [Pseudomonas aeruginosa]
MNHELKIRAKRLRRAVSVVLGQDIKTSQSLELVAREENYPNWDAACACAGESWRGNWRWKIYHASPAIGLPGRALPRCAPAVCWNSRISATEWLACSAFARRPHIVSRRRTWHTTASGEPDRRVRCTFRCPQ